jgi:sortase A
MGDDIILKFDGVAYTYRVIDKVEVKPDNLSVLDQPYDNEYLRLITCTPPGTYLRRAVITAALIH